MLAHTSGPGASFAQGIVVSADMVLAGGGAGVGFGGGSVGYGSHRVLGGFDVREEQFGVGVNPVEHV